MNAEALAQIAQKQGLQGLVFHSVQQAFDAAQKKAHETDMVLVTGSFFTVAEILNSN
jgi:folylpolyglutamate synthase/dihydropteroate synthase